MISDAGFSPRLRPVTLAVMAFSAGAAVANIYYVQPLLDVLRQSFPAAPRLVALLPTANQIGFGLGLFFLVPLGDGLDRRKLIFGQLFFLALALTGAALATHASLLFAAMVAVGIGASVAQQIVPFAAELAPPERRGATVGTVMSGLLLGILLGRVASGAIAALWGWRMVFVMGLGLDAAMALLLALALPAPPPKPPLSYGRLLVSLLALYAELLPLRRAALAQAGLFGAFSAFWATLALRLAAPPFTLGPAAAGLFGLVGAAGALAAPLAGRTADQRGPAAVIRLGISLTALSWVVFAFSASLSGLVLGVILLDLGVQMALIAHQSVIYALRPEARSRINTVFVTTMFAGGALGSAGAGLAWQKGGYAAVALFGFALALASMIVHLLPAAKTRRGVHGEHPDRT
jgi:predicted MFS family arabinose efflux permease